MIYRVNRSGFVTIDILEEGSITEISIDKLKGFKVDISEKRGRGNHNGRIKICPKDSNDAHGTSVPFETPRDPDKYYTFDQIASLNGIQKETSTKKFLDFEIGFVTLYQKELVDMLEDDSELKREKINNISIAFKDYKNKYMDPGSLSYNKNKIRADANSEIFEKMKK